MKWKGERIKALAKENKISYVKLSELTGVTRQTVKSWIDGQVPKGTHLISLCKIFNISPNHLFAEEDDAGITVPAHRTRQKAKVTPDRQKDALNLAREYANFFKNDKNSIVLPVVRTRGRDITVIKKIAEDLRKRSGITKKNEPLDYKHVFNLYANLGIKAVFRYFPEKLKTYAFFTKIYGHRVVFVNNSTNVLDLIFPLIHEAVHAIQDEKQISDIFDADEEKFCDDVANHTQFPDEYVSLVHRHINTSNNKGMQVNTLKLFAEQNRHALFGLVNRIKSLNPSFNLHIGGANSNLKKGFPTVGEVLFSDDDPRSFVMMINNLSPLLVHVVINQIDSLTDRKLGEILGLDNILDTRLVKDELIKMRDIPD